MKDFLLTLTTPTVLAFITIGAGACLGRVRFKGLSLGLPAIMIAGIILSIICSLLSNTMGDSSSFVDYEKMKMISTLGSTMFMSVIGWNCGVGIRRYGISHACLYFLCGVVIVSTNFSVLMLVGSLDHHVSMELLGGIFCGAMTSTPGVVVLTAMSNDGGQLASAGYSSSYFLGVMITVLFVQWLNRRSNIDQEFSKYCQTDEIKRTDMLTAVMMLCAIAVWGYVMGEIRMPLDGVILGPSIGIFIVGIAFGIFCGNKQLPKNIDGGFRVIRDLGFCFFYAANGIIAGSTFLQTFQLENILYGILFTVIPLFYGVIVSTLLKIPSKLCLLSGAMTCTPALNALANTKPHVIDYTAYTFSYTGALITMIICMRFIYII